MMSYRDWPIVLKRKWAITCTMGLLFLVVGGVVYLALDDKTLLFISVILVLCTALRCASLYHAICMGNYEIVEGTCIEIGKVGLHRQRRVRLLEDDGNEYSLLLDKRTPIRIGRCYRMYLEEAAGRQSEPDLIPALTASRLLALEDLGEIQAE